jgi:hypothetical protein
MITDQNTGTISIVHEKKDGLSYEFDIWITEREYYENFLKIKFACIKNLDFFTKRITTTHQGGIKDIIESLYPGTSDFRIESSITDDIVFYQSCETNYETCKKLCYAFKDKSIFAFGFDGLLIKDLRGLKDHKGNDESQDDPKSRLTLETDRLSVQTQTYKLKYNKYLNHESFSAWEDTEDKESTTENYSEVMSKNAKVIMNYKEYRVMGKTSADLISNAWNNKSVMESKGYTSLRIVQPDIPHYKLGDVVLYERALQERSLPWKNYLIASNELFYSTDGNKIMDPNGFRFSWTSHLYGLEDGDWSKEPSA